MKRFNQITKLGAFLLLLFSVPFPAVAAKEKQFYSKSTAINWTLEVEKDQVSNAFEGEKIDSENLTGIAHPGLGIRCELHLARGKFGYDPIAVTYARDEERSSVVCEMDGYKLGAKTVVCAKAHSKNKVGTIHGDATELTVAKDKKTFGIKLACVVK